MTWALLASSLSRTAEWFGFIFSGAWSDDHDLESKLAAALEDEFFGRAE